MKLASILGIRGARDKPRDSYGSTAYSFVYLIPKMLFGTAKMLQFLTAL